MKKQNFIKKLNERINESQMLINELNENHPSTNAEPLQNIDELEREIETLESIRLLAEKEL